MHGLTLQLIALSTAGLAVPAHSGGRSFPLGGSIAWISVHRERQLVAECIQRVFGLCRYSFSPFRCPCQDHACSYQKELLPSEANIILLVDWLVGVFCCCLFVCFCVCFCWHVCLIVVFAFLCSGLGFVFSWLWWGLFVCLLVCLSVCLFACLLVCLFICHGVVGFS